eukprot:ANDGO_00951.mRNA.1 hypothetical protein
MSASLGLMLGNPSEYAGLNAQLLNQAPYAHMMGIMGCPPPMVPPTGFMISTDHLTPHIPSSSSLSSSSQYSCSSSMATASSSSSSSSTSSSSSSSSSSTSSSSSSCGPTYTHNSNIRLHSLGPAGGEMQRVSSSSPSTSVFSLSPPFSMENSMVHFAQPMMASLATSRSVIAKQGEPSRRSPAVPTVAGGGARMNADEQSCNWTHPCPSSEPRTVFGVFTKTGRTCYRAWTPPILDVLSDVIVDPGDAEWYKTTVYTLLIRIDATSSPSGIFGEQALAVNSVDGKPRLRFFAKVELLDRSGSVVRDCFRKEGVEQREGEFSSLMAPVVSRDQPFTFQCTIGPFSIQKHSFACKDNPSPFSLRLTFLMVDAETAVESVVGVSSSPKFLVRSKKPKHVVSVQAGTRSREKTAVAIPAHPINKYLENIRRVENLASCGAALLHHQQQQQQQQHHHHHHHHRS